MKRLPELKIVSINDIIIHEYSDLKRVEKLSKKIGKKRFLRNPIIVAKIPDNEKYLLLDGVTRFFSLKRMGLKDTFVQVMDYMDDKLKLGSWFHLIIGIDETDFIKGLNGIKGIKIEKEPKKVVERKLKCKEIIAYFRTTKKENYAIRTGISITNQIKKLNEVFALYKDISEVRRISCEQADYLSKTCKTATGIMIFPVFTKEELIEIGLNHYSLPPGITKHIVPERVLNFNLPLKILRSKASLKEKKAALEVILQKKIENQNIRLYPEKIYIFDE